MVVLFTPGEQHESTVFIPLMERGAVKRPGRGRPKRRPRRVVGDKGYRAASRRDSYPHIRRLKNYRRLATRYDTSVGNFGTLWVIGFIIMWANV